MNNSIEVNRQKMLVISACPADMHLCLGVIKREDSRDEILVLVTWANSEMQHKIISVFSEKCLSVKIRFVSGLEACKISQDTAWESIYLFSMGTAWLGRILYDRIDILHYRDCYLKYNELGLRDIRWNHLEIIKMHGLKFWLRSQMLRVLTRVKYHSYKFEYRPDSHIWPQTDLIRKVWEHDDILEVSVDMAELPDNSVIFCFSSTDNGWTPDWSIFKDIADNFYCKLHPRTRCVDYLDYPDWVKPLNGYELPMELYRCPDSSLIVGTTSAALGSTHNSISLWKIKVSDWVENARGFIFHNIFLNKSSMNNFNCRDDLHDLFDAYARRAGCVAYSYPQLVNWVAANQKLSTKV